MTVLCEIFLRDPNLVLKKKKALHKMPEGFFKSDY